MTAKADAQTLRDIALALPQGERAKTLLRVAAALEFQALREEEHARLRLVGHAIGMLIRDRVDSLTVNYTRLAELRALAAKSDDAEDPQAHLYESIGKEAMDELEALEDAAGDSESEEQAYEAIQDDVLEIEVSATWSPNDTSEFDFKPKPNRAVLPLDTDGAPVRLVCELDEKIIPRRAGIEIQDSLGAWFEYEGHECSQSELLTYCGKFNFDYLL